MKEQKFETLKTAEEYMENLKNGVKTIIKYIKRREIGKATDTIVLFCNGIDWLMEAIELTKEIQKETVDFKDLNKKLQEIVEALGNEDYDLVGDLFDYEINPILEHMHNKIKVSVQN